MFNAVNPFPLLRYNINIHWYLPHLRKISSNLYLQHKSSALSNSHFVVYSFSLSFIDQFHNHNKPSTGTQLSIKSKMWDKLEVCSSILYLRRPLSRKFEKHWWNWIHDKLIATSSTVTKSYSGTFSHNHKPQCAKKAIKSALKSIIKSLLNLDKCVFLNRRSTKETNQQVQLAVDTRRDRGGIFYLPWFTILCITDTVIVGFFCLMSSVFFFLADNTFSSVCANAGRPAIPPWKMELCAHHACTTSLSDSSVMPLWLSVLVNMVSMANEWNPKTVKPVTYFNYSCMYGHVPCFGQDVISLLYWRGPKLWFYINIQKCTEDIYTLYQLNKQVMCTLHCGKYKNQILQISYKPHNFTNTEPWDYFSALFS